MTHPPARFVMFDCDGVLVNSEDLVAQATDEVFAEFGLFYSPAEKQAIFLGLSHEEHLRRVAADYAALYGAPLPDHYNDRLAQRYNELEQGNLQATAGILTVLEALKANNVPFCVASNSDPANIERKLRQTGLFGHFYPHIYSKTMVARPKPAPDVYEFAARALGAASTAECVVIEDSPVGVRAGAASGAYVIGLRVSDINSVSEQALRQAGAHAVVSSMAEAGALLARRLSLPPAPARPWPGPSP